MRITAVLCVTFAPLSSDDICKQPHYADATVRLTLGTSATVFSRVKQRRRTHCFRFWKARRLRNPMAGGLSACESSPPPPSPTPAHILRTDDERCCKNSPIILFYLRDATDGEISELQHSGRRSFRRDVHSSIQRRGHIVSCSPPAEIFLV